MNIGNQKSAIQQPGLFTRSGWFQELGKFAAIGVLNTGLDWGIYLLLAQEFGLAPVIAKIISYSIGIINSYFLNRYWTFQSRAHFTRAFPLFLGISLAGILINSAGMYFALYFLKFNDVVALILATSAAFAWNFLSSRRFVFKE